MRAIPGRQPVAPLVSEAVPAAAVVADHPVGDQTADAAVQRDALRGRGACPPTVQAHLEGRARRHAAALLLADEPQDRDLEFADAQALHGCVPYRLTNVSNCGRTLVGKQGPV